LFLTSRARAHINTYTVQAFDQLVKKVEEGIWGQTKARMAGLGSSISGDKAGAAKKQAQSLAMGSNAFALFDQFKQDMLELTKSTDQLQFNKNFPEQAKFITNIEANLAVLKAGNVGEPAAAEQQPDVATTKGAASAAARADRAQTNQQNQDQARAAANPADAAATLGNVAASVQTTSVHVNDVDMINEAYYGMQEAPLGKAKWAARKAKMGNLFKTVTGRGGEVVDATMAAVNSRMETFKAKFQKTLGKLQTDLTAVGLGAESPALQAITNTLGSAEQIPPTTKDAIAAATPEEPPAEEPVPGEPTGGDAAADAEVAAQQQAADDEAGARDAETQAGAADDDDAAAAAAADAERQQQADAEAEYYADQPEEPDAAPEVPKKRELSQTPGNIARRAKTAAAAAAKAKKRGQMNQKNSRARDKTAGLAMDPANIKRREKRRGTWRGESAIRGTRGFNEFVSRYL